MAPLWQASLSNSGSISASFFLLISSSGTASKISCIWFIMVRYLEIVFDIRIVWTVLSACMIYLALCHGSLMYFVISSSPLRKRFSSITRLSHVGDASITSLSGVLLNNVPSQRYFLPTLVQEIP